MIITCDIYVVGGETISARHTGHPTSICDTRIARDSQNRACPHGTSANQHVAPRGTVFAAAVIG